MVWLLDKAVGVVGVAPVVVAMAVVIVVVPSAVALAVEVAVAPCSGLLLPPSCSQRR